MLGLGLDSAAVGGLPLPSSDASGRLQRKPISWTKGELVGQGAFGSVCVAMDNDTGELIAVKQASGQVMNAVAMIVVCCGMQLRLQAASDIHTRAFAGHSQRSIRLRHSYCPHPLPSFHACRCMFRAAQPTLRRWKRMSGRWRRRCSCCSSLTTPTSFATWCACLRGMEPCRSPGVGCWCIATSRMPPAANDGWSCTLNRQASGRMQGTEKTDDSLNIFLEYVPGGSIASLLAKFGSFKESVIKACAGLL